MNLLSWILRALLPAAIILAGGAANGRPPTATSPARGKALVILHTRVAAPIPIPEGELRFRPYDRATGRLDGPGYRPSGHRFSVGRWIGFISNKSMRNWKGWAIEVEPGSYVLGTVTNPSLAKRDGPVLSRSWAFDVAPGTVTYVGDYTLQWTPLHKGWGLNVVTEVDEPRARAFVAANTQTRATFVTAPARPVEVSREGPKQRWTVRDVPQSGAKSE